MHHKRRVGGREADRRGTAEPCGGILSPVAPGGSRVAAGVKECGAKRRIPRGALIEKARH